MEIDPDIIDAGKRASDIVNTFRIHNGWDELKTKWLAISLADGSNDGTLYDTRRDAVRHQRDEFRCAYVAFRNLPQGSRPREMAIYLQFHRDAYKNGMRLTDPEHSLGGKEALLTSARYDTYRQLFSQKPVLS